MEGDPPPPTAPGCIADISIHTLRVEGDSNFDFVVPDAIEFQSTPSAWRVTDRLIVFYNFTDISIHTLRVEGDTVMQSKPDKHLQISIHTLRVEGDASPAEVMDRTKTFQSTPSAWRVTLVISM